MSQAHNRFLPENLNRKIARVEFKRYVCYQLVSNQRHNCTALWEVWDPEF